MLPTDEVPQEEVPKPSSLHDLARALEEVHTEPDEIVMAGNHDELRPAVCLTLDILGLEPALDDDGDFSFTCGGRTIWVVLRKDQPTIQIATPVVHHVHSRRATAVELSILNRTNPLVRWTLHERTVFQEVAITAFPFVPAHLGQAMAHFASALAHSQDLSLRTGGRLVP